MVNTADEIADSDGLSNETVTAAVYQSVLGVAKALEWRDKLERVDSDKAANVTAGSRLGLLSLATISGTSQKASVANETTSQDVRHQSVPQAHDDVPGPVLVAHHFSRAIFLRSRLTAARSHGSWPELQTSIPSSGNDWLLASLDGEILAAGGRWPTSGRVTNENLAEKLDVDGVDLSQWQEAFAAHDQRPALALFRQENGVLLMSQSLSARTGFSEVSTPLAVVQDTGGRPYHPAGQPQLGLIDRTAPAFLLEKLLTAWTETAANRVARRFGFDQDEISLLRRLLTGTGWIELSIGTGTQRSSEVALLGRMLNKTGAPNCPEMLRFLTCLVSQTVCDGRIATGVKSVAQQELVLPSGLRSQYLSLGADRGQPVIFVHGIFDGIAGVQRLQPMLRAQGLRVLAPIRCGYGASHRLPRGVDPVDVFVTQLEALIEAEKLENPILLGHRSGCIFAAAAGRRLRDRLGGVVCVGTTLPSPSIGHVRALRGHQRALALSAAHASAMLPLVVRSWSRSVRQKGPQVLVARQIARDSTDSELLADPALRAVLDQSHRMMMQRGRGGFEIDLKLAVRPRETRHSTNAAPTIYLHGGSDKLTSVDKLQAALGGGANFQIRVSKRAGAMLLYSQPELVFSAINDLRQKTL
ncbi:alpha/beta hydrolase [Phaeobacter sp. C3_T13_0]|uniref:alpha/beta hydrolase n=1 Tax=Phaeobacter cretensis TaxID=3342641 RepID=UPI0039BD6ACE